VWTHNLCVSQHASRGGIEHPMMPIQYLLQVELFTHGACDALWGCFPCTKAEAQQRKTGCALTAMMRCVATEDPQISWQARDVSAAQALPDLDLRSTDTAAELADWANITAAPLLVSCAESLSEDSLFELVGLAT